MLEQEKYKTSLAAGKYQMAQKHTSGKGKPRSWLRWLISKPFDWISTPIYLGTCLSLFYEKSFFGLSNPEFQWWQIVTVLAAVLLLLALDRYEFWRWGEEIPRQVATGYLLLRVGLIGLISWINPNEITLFMYLIIPFSALVYFGILVGIEAGLLVWVVFVGRVAFFPPSSIAIQRPLPFINIFTICLVFVLTTGYTLKREKASRTRAERLLQELEQSQLQVEELAATKERNRLARDIHDSLGHYLTVISVLLGKARAFKEKNSDEAEQALTDARRLANEALTDVRASVNSLRTSQELFSLERSLPVLVAGLQNEQLAINLAVVGSEEGISKQTLMVLYRVAQEGLTNVQRHSGADRVKLELKFDKSLTELSLADNGQGFSPQSLPYRPNSGYGLAGLRERLQMIGGEFELDSQPGNGTRLVARVYNSLTPVYHLPVVQGITVPEWEK